jgi:RNA polymerase sporulation-specific sigma factor
MSGVISMSQAMDGIGARKMDEIEQMVEANTRLVYFVLNKYFPSMAQDDDAIQVGLIGLWRAAQRFDPSRNLRFSTYAAASIWGSVKQYRRDLRGRRKHPAPPILSLDGPVHVDENGGELSCGDIDFDMPGPSVEEAALSSVALRGFFARLNERQRLIVLELMQGKNQPEIAAIIGVSQVQISRDITVLRRKIGPRPKPRAIKPCDPPAWSQDRIEDPDPDPVTRGNLRWIQITAPHDRIQFKPAKKRRQSKSREKVRALLAQGINDPWEIAARLGVGVEAARRWIKILEEEGESHG